MRRHLIFAKMSLFCTTILEARFDTILPTLATKADLAELKAELKVAIRAESASLSRWMAGMFITMIIGFGGMVITMISMFPR